MSKDDKPEDFAEGFVVGFQAVRGRKAFPKSIPAPSEVRGSKTFYLMGIRRGVEKALGVKLDEVDKQKDKKDGFKEPALAGGKKPPVAPPFAKAAPAAGAGRHGWPDFPASGRR